MLPEVLAENQILRLVPDRDKNCERRRRTREKLPSNFVQTALYCHQWRPRYHPEVSLYTTAKRGEREVQAPAIQKRFVHRFLPVPIPRTRLWSARRCIPDAQSWRYILPSANRARTNKRLRLGRKAGPL